MKTQSGSWSDALRNGKEPLFSDLAELVFCLSSSAVRLEKLSNYKDRYGIDINTKRAKFITLLTHSILHNSLKSLEELESDPLGLVYVVHKVHFKSLWFRI